jgi:F-type H+-transporting ATPase subunit gamma
MKNLAASSIGQYEKSVLALADYSNTIERGLSVCFRAGGLAPVLTESKYRPHTGHTVLVIFGSDQGLVGQFNDVIADHALAALAKMPGKPQVWVVGELVYERLVDAGIQIKGHFPVPNSIGGVTPLVRQILIESQSHRHRDLDNELYLFFNILASGAGYMPTSQKILPLDEDWRSKIAELPWKGKNLPEVIGDLSSTIQTLVREYLFVSIFRACAESLASENTSRLAAMQRADKNIDELLEDLNNSFHRLRQSDIDEELFDVIAGYEALSIDKDLRTHN